MNAATLTFSTDITDNDPNNGQADSLQDDLEDANSDPANSDPKDSGTSIDSLQAKSSLICDAFTFAYNLHQGQYRASGEPYIAHPVAVAGLLRDLGGSPAMIAAGFLHDVIEDTEVWHRGAAVGRGCHQALEV
jgi:hypothetical protein